MPSKTDSRNAEPAANNFDDLDNYFMDGDVDDDPFASPKPEDNSKSNKRKEPGDGLGIDEEVSVAKKARVPRIKLDQDRYVNTHLRGCFGPTSFVLTSRQIGFRKWNSCTEKKSRKTEAEGQRT